MVVGRGSPWYKEDAARSRLDKDSEAPTQDFG